MSISYTERTRGPVEGCYPRTPFPPAALPTCRSSGPTKAREFYSESTAASLRRRSSEKVLDIAAVLLGRDWIHFVGGIRHDHALWVGLRETNPSIVLLARATS